MKLLKLVPYAFALVVIFFLGSWLYHLGADKTKALWDADTQRRNTAMNQKEEAYEALEVRVRVLTTGLNDELAKANKDHDIAFERMRAQYAIRLRNSEARASVYQRQAESGPAECQRLASHAAQLDRSLEEGRRVVGELRTTLGLRDTQLIQLGNQIKADRLLLDAD